MHILSESRTEEEMHEHRCAKCFHNDSEFIFASCLRELYTDANSIFFSFVLFVSVLHISVTQPTRLLSSTLCAFALATDDLVGYLATFQKFYSSWFTLIVRLRRYSMFYE